MNTDSEGRVAVGGDAPDVVVVEGADASVSICKKVMTPAGRALEDRRVHAGRTARFRIRVTNLGTDVARDVRVCDLLPPGMTLVRAPPSSSRCSRPSPPS